jgi:microcystin degradation protein MlrC
LRRHKPRVAIAGFQHETNSYGIGLAGLEEFEMADSWPRLLTGSEVIDETRGMNLPIAGFAAAAKTQADLHPLIWCAAEPSGVVTDLAFDTIAWRIVKGLQQIGQLDAVYLDLHGAMITQSHSDGEGALLDRIRSVVGHELPIAISLDMHANISTRMISLADEICVYKTYPHLDMAETGTRCWARLRPLLLGYRPTKAFRRAPFAVPLNAQHTGAEPARRLYAALPDDDTGHVEMALGFTAGDTPDAAPSIIAYAATPAEANARAEAALERLIMAKELFDTHLTDPAHAIAEAMAAKRGRPIVLADVQDNPGAGASSDTTGLLHALIQAGAQGVILGLMHDPVLAALAHDAGQGAVFPAAMGGKSGLAEDRPYRGRFRVLALNDGHVHYTGAMYGGGVATLGRSCALHVEEAGADVTVVVTSIRNQCLDLAQFKHFGLDPARARIVVVKSTAHFRADFEPIAAKVIAVGAPGLFPCTPPFLLRHTRQ